MTDRTNTVHSSMTLTMRSDLEVVFTRVFDAPRELVLKAYTDPQLIPKWWGPRALTTTVEMMDVRPEGTWRFVQRDAAGNEYGFHGINREIVPPERFVSTFEFEGMPGRVVLNTATFEELSGKTKLTVVALFRTIEDRDGYLQGGMEDGAAEGYDRLAELLQNMTTSDREIVLARVFDAPRELVWEAWIDPAHVAQWWGPNGFTTTTHEMDVKPGGVWRLVMHGPDGADYNNRISYIEVVKPERLVYMHDSGEEGDDGFHVTVTFAEQGGTTNVTMRSLFPSAEERDKVVREFGAIEGGNQTLARLAEYLKQM